MQDLSSQGPIRQTQVELAYEVLSKCVQGSAPNGLAKLLLDNLSAISEQSDQGLGTFDPDSTQMDSLHASVPEVLAHLIRIYGVEGITHIDRLLNDQSLNNDTLSFYRAGCEAIALKISGVSEVLFKLSLFHDTPAHPAVLIPLRTMYLPQKDLPHDQKVRFSVVPFIAGEYQSFDELGLNSEQIREHRDRIHLFDASFAPQPKSEPRKMTITTVQELLKCKGIVWSDKKPSNIRFHPDYPDLPLIIDRRSVERIALPNSAKPTKEQNALLDKYLAAQEAISKPIIAAYASEGRIENLIKGIINKAFLHTYELLPPTIKLDQWGKPASFIPRFRKRSNEA